MLTSMCMKGLLKSSRETCMDVWKSFMDFIFHTKMNLSFSYILHEISEALCVTVAPLPLHICKLWGTTCSCIAFWFATLSRIIFHRIFYKLRRAMGRSWKWTTHLCAKETWCSDGCKGFGPGKTPDSSMTLPFLIWEILGKSLNFYENSFSF